MRRSDGILEAARRKSEQGSQELQGEVLELDIQAALEHRFPQDLIKPAPTLMQMGGLLGQVTLSGEGLTPFWPYLCLGQWTHASKGTSMGL